MFGICESRVGETSTFRESLRVAVFFLRCRHYLFLPDVMRPQEDNCVQYDEL